MLRDRRLLLRNQVRTQYLLDLITLNQRGLANLHEYAARIREHLVSHDGRPPLQRAGITGGAQPHGACCLLSGRRRVRRCGERGGSLRVPLTVSNGKSDGPVDEHQGQECHDNGQREEPEDLG